MGRLTEALRRAGQAKDEPLAGTDNLPPSWENGPHVAEPAAAESAPSGDTPHWRGGPENATPPGREMAGATKASPYPDNRSRLRVERRAIRSHQPKRASRSQSDEVAILDILSTLNRRKSLIAAVTAAFIALAVTYNDRATPIYQANARLLLEPNTPEVAPVRSLTGDQSRLDYYITQLEVLRSPSTARKALERLELLAENPTDQSAEVNQLLAALSVAPVKSDMGESRVVNIIFRSAKPTLAAAVPNALAEAYIDSLLEEKRQASVEAASWLNQRVADLRREARSSDDALLQYREQKDGVSLDSQQNIVVQKLAQLNALVTTTRTERAEREAVYQQLKAIQASGTSLDTFSPVLASSFIQGVKAELAGLQREREQLAERLGELHPDMIKVNMAVATAERRLHDEMAKIVDGVENDYRAALAKEQALSVALEDQKREVLKLNGKAIGYSALQRDNANTQQLLQTVAQRAKEAELSVESHTTNAKILDHAEEPRAPIWPRAQLNLMLALFGGAFLGICFALALEYLNPNITKPQHITLDLSIPLLGIAPRFGRPTRNRAAILDAVPPSFEEALRVIRTRIFLSPIAGVAQSIAVTSTKPGEGKTLIASNLAVSMAMSGRRVLLVDADLRKPQLHRTFGLAKAPGLSEVLAGQVNFSDALQPSRVNGLVLLSCGTDAQMPTDLLDRERLTEVIRSAEDAFDMVVLDCPPVMAVADAAIVANVASSVLFVVGSGMTSHEAARVAIDRIAAVQGQIVGAVLNNAKIGRGSEYASSYYYSESAPLHRYATQGAKGEEV
jgi:capsular exopolysaccharide synthesis family protein